MKKVKMTPRCSKCGTRYPVGFKNNVPTMVGFVLKNGNTVNVCNICMIQLGKCKTDEEKDKFFNDIKGI